MSRVVRDTPTGKGEGSPGLQEVRMSHDGGPWAEERGSIRSSLRGLLPCCYEGIFSCKRETSKPARIKLGNKMPGIH